MLGVYVVGDPLTSQGIVYAATMGGLSYSTDGINFTNVTSGLASAVVKRVYASDSGIYAATGAGVSFASVTKGTGVVTGSAAFTDPAGRILTYTTTGTSLGGGTVSVDAATGAFTFTPTAAQRAVATANTTDSFTITASNGVNTREQTVTVAVAAQ